MFTVKSVFRLFSTLLIALFLPALALGAPGMTGRAQARAALRPAAASFGQQAYLKASNPGAEDAFGSPLASDGDTAVVGTPYEDSGASGVNGNEADESAPDAGAVYVFTRSGNTWSQQAYLKASNSEAGDGFGYAVAISGDTLVVGVPNEASNAGGVDGDQTDNSAPNAGAVYVFTRSGGSWSQQAYLKASNSGEWDGFGGAVSISGDTLVVGALGEDSAATGVDGDQGDDSAGLAGAAYIFTRSGGDWSQQAYLKASNAGSGDEFGESVAISGDNVVVGAPYEDSNASTVDGAGTDNSALDSGAAYVFTRSGGAWSQQAYLKASNSGAGDAFGRSAAISGDTLAVGAYYEDSNASSLNGNGADNSAPDSGAVYVFTLSGGVWSQKAYLKAYNSQAGDFFGESVSISGDTLVVGADREDSNGIGPDGPSDNSAENAGAAYVFIRSYTFWTQEAYIKAANAEADDYFGYAVSVSGDTLLVGAPNEASNASGVNGNQADNSVSDAGAAYTFFLFPQVVSSYYVSVNPANDHAVDFNVAFSDPVTGVDTSDFALATTGGAASAAILEVSDGPVDYTVTIDIGAGDGTIRLDVIDDDSIRNASLIPLGGVDAGNGNFTSGSEYTVDTSGSSSVLRTFISAARQDGQVLESTETSEVGGKFNAEAAVLRVGDDGLNRQYRSILHFNTASLPDHAVILSATLYIRKQGFVGQNPFTTHGGLRADIGKPFFGTSAALQLVDFQAAAGAMRVAAFSGAPVNGWYSAVLNSAGLARLNRAGASEFRLRFATDDNNDRGADYLTFYSGNAAIDTNRPWLAVEFIAP